MFRVKKQFDGLGNIFIHLSQLPNEFPVSKKSLTAGYRGKYLEFTNLHLVEDDDIVPSTETPPIYINPYTSQYIHPLCRTKVKPSSILLEHLSKYPSSFPVGIAIRLGKMHKDDYQNVADEHALKVFNSIIEKEQGPIFLATDSLEYKKELDTKFPGKLFFIDRPLVVVNSDNIVDDPLPFLEFFLLSKCNQLYITGGNKDFSCFSTYGYMASIYGSKPFTVVWNDK